MKIKQVYMGQPVALDRSPGELLGTVIAIKKKIVKVRLRGIAGTQQYGIKVLVGYRGG